MRPLAVAPHVLGTRDGDRVQQDAAGHGARGGWSQDGGSGRGRRRRRVRGRAARRRRWSGSGPVIADRGSVRGAGRPVPERDVVEDVTASRGAPAAMRAIDPDPTPAAAHILTCSRAVTGAMSPLRGRLPVTAVPGRGRPRCRRRARAAWPESGAHPGVPGCCAVWRGSGWRVVPGGCGPGCAAPRWRSGVVAVSPAARADPGGFGARRSPGRPEALGEARRRSPPPDAGLPARSPSSLRLPRSVGAQEIAARGEPDDPLGVFVGEEVCRWHSRHQGHGGAPPCSPAS